jgi:hypothetical protein
LLPPAGEQGQLPLPHEEAPTTAGKTERHGTPGATAAAGTAEMQAPPPREPDLTAAKGPEDYGKKTPPREAGSGMNVGEVDPTLAAAIRPAEEAAAARPGEILRGPIPESPAGAQKGGGNIVKPLDARPTGELIQLARRGELSPFMRDSLANELERRGIRRMPEPARAEPPNVGTQPRAREEAARQATQQATAPGPMRQFMQDERGGGRYPFRQLLRDERGGGRITEPPKREPAPAERPGPKLTSFERAKKMTNEQLQAEIARTDIPRVQKAVFSDALRARGEKPNPAAAAKTPTELRQITPTIPTKPGLTERAAKAGISENQQYVRDRIAPPDSIFDKIPRDREGWKEFVHKRYERTVAEFHPAARKAAEIERLLGRPLEKQEDFNRLARSLKGLGGKMESIYREGPFDPETRKVIGPALDPILKKIGDNPKEFEAYAVAKRAIEKGGQGLKTGVDLKRANSVVAELGSRWGQTFKELQTFQSAMLRTAKHLIGEEGIRKIEEANKDYIPWYRAMDPQTQLGDVFATGGGLRVKDPLEKFKGSERQIVSPLDSVLKNTIMLVDLAEKNEALRAMKRADDTFVKAGGKSFMQPSKTGQPFHFSEDMRKRMTDSGIPEDMIERMKFTDAKAFAPDTNRIRLFENGKEKLYDVPSDIARMINGLDRGAVHWAIKVLGKPAQWLRAGATLTPEFATKNIVRDQWTAFIQAQGYKGYIPVYDALYHSVGRIFDPQLRKEFNNWLRNGGANANLMSLDRKMLELDPRSFKDKLANVVTTPSDLKAVLHDLNPITHLRTISEAFENATRFGAHMREVKRGTAAEEAAFRARELTIDFGRMGASPVIRALNSIVPFFNANIQGLDRYGRAIKNDPVPTMLKTLGAITAPSLLLWAYNKDDPRYQELPQWQKMLFWIIPTDNWRNVRPEEEKKLRQNASNAWFRKDPKTGNLQYNDGTLWRVPKPFAEGQLFGSLPERALEAFIQHKPNAWKKVAESIFDTLTPSFIPQAARPVWEQQRNWNDFLGRELMSEFTAKKPQEQQTDRGTTETAKAISGAFRSVLGKEPVGQLGSPIVIDNYIRELTAGLGSLAVKGVGPVGIDPLIRAFQGKEIPPGPERTMADIPGIKAFVTRFPDKGAQSIQDFYDLRKEGQTAKAGGDKNAWIGDDTAKALSGQRQMIDKFMADKDMSPADKRSAIDVTTLMMIDAAKRGIELQGKAEQRQRDIQERKRQRVQ